MMRTISNFRQSVLILLASISTISCAHSQEYFAFSHCWENPRDLHELLSGVDTIGIASVKGIESREPYDWQTVTFSVSEQIKGVIAPNFAHPGQVIDRNDPKFTEAIASILKRATAHDTPEFLASEVRKFPRYSDIEQVIPRKNASGKTVPVSVSGTCMRVPILLEGIEYLILVRDEKIVSIEPILDSSDYWLGFVRSLLDHNYWPIYRDE